MANEHYAEFIKEAFIDPIRSVLIVDDDYPTFEEILGNPIQQAPGAKDKQSKAWHKDPEKIKGVIESFRNRERSLLVDINDGTNLPDGDAEKVAEHLHQSDLLILDYELDKSNREDGTRAIRIARNLLANDHFNLVVIHTVTDLDHVFEKVLIGLLRPSPSRKMSKKDEKKAEELIKTAGVITESGV